MANLFEDAADARQSDRSDRPTSRFRPTYRALSDAETALHDAIKTKAAELETLFEQVPAGRHHDLALIALEAAVMWNVKALTA